MRSIGLAVIVSSLVAALALPAHADSGRLPLMDRVNLRLARQASRASHRDRARSSNSGSRETRSLASSSQRSNSQWQNQLRTTQQRTTQQRTTQQRPSSERFVLARRPADTSWLGQLRFDLAKRSYRSAQNGVAKYEAELQAAGRLVTKESEYREVERWIWNNLDASKRAGLVYYEEFKPWDGTIISFSADTSWSPHWTLSSKGMKLLDYTTPEAKARAIGKATQRLDRAKSRASEALSNLNRLSVP